MYYSGAHCTCQVSRADLTLWGTRSCRWQRRLRVHGPGAGPNVLSVRTPWRFTEHRQDPPLLPPGTSWMQGAAGIAAFLLRLARVLENGLGAPVIDRPDQWWAVPAPLRTIHTSPGPAPDAA